MGTGHKFQKKCEPSGNRTTRNFDTQNFAYIAEQMQSCPYDMQIPHRLGQKSRGGGEGGGEIHCWGNKSGAHSHAFEGLFGRVNFSNEWKTGVGADRTVVGNRKRP